MSAEVKMVSITIDGTPVQVPAGTLVIRAAESVGKYIPRFCDHPLLDPLGACRQCLVEVEGQRKPLTACTTAVSEGMVVKTQFTSEVAADAQEGVLELLLINHPLDCPMCDKGGECPLQDQALAYGPGGSRYIDPKRRFTKPVPISPLVKLDRERCVLCARCTRFSDQISGDPFIELFERGAMEQVAIFEDEPYESVFSGNVIQICPVGALTSSTFRFKARPFDMTEAASTCNRCASGCSISIEERRGGLVRVLARENLDVNDEWICDKGRFGYAYTQQPERITEPMIRKNGEFVAVSWAEAIELVAGKIRDAREAGRPAAVIGGQQLLDEDSYALSRFARAVLGTNDVDARARGGTAEEDALLATVVRSRAATNEDIDGASVIIVVGTDLQQTSPIVFLRARKAARARGATIVEIGPRRSALARMGASWLACAPGAEAEILGDLLRGAEDGSGDAALAPLVAKLREGAAVVLAGEQLSASRGAMTAAWNLSVALGASFGWIPRKAGARGALAAGLHPDLLPFGRALSDADEVSGVWGTSIATAPGRDAAAILENAHEYGIVYFAGADPIGDGVDPRALDAADFVVAHDMFATETAKRAHLVLPVAALYERDGTITNWEGRAQDVRAAVAAPGLAQRDFEILAQIARATGVAFPHTLEQLRAEMRSLARAPGDPERLQPVAGGGASAGSGGLAVHTYQLLLDDGTMMAGADLLRASAPDGGVQIHPDDAAKAGIADGDEVNVSFATGDREQMRARVTTAVAPGVLAVGVRTRANMRAPGATASVEKVTG